MVQKTIDSLIRNFSPVNPATSVPQLVRLYNEVSKVNDSYWKELKQKEIQSLIEYCSGLFLEATVGNPYAFEGDSLKIQLTLNNRAGVNVSAAKASVNGAIYSFGMVKPNNNITQGVSMLLNETSQSMQPYWLQHSMDAGSFAVMDQQLIGRAENEAPKVLFNLIIEGTSFVFEKPIRYKFTDPVKGELYQPYVVLPKNTPVESELRANVKLNLLNEKRDGGNKSLASTQHANENTSRLVLRNISYDHIPSINYFRIDSVLEVSLDLKIGGKKIGYIEGAGDKVVSALQQMGYDVTILSDKELDAVDLTIYNAIITGVRAYNVRPTLNNYYDKLMKYIEQGGNLIVQYNTSSQIGPIKAKIGPYPFTISRTRVTDENASVNVLKPKHPLLNYPNKITAKDFENWVQERSIYHAQGWDPNYETIFAMNDVGEKADEGSLIVAKYGKGNFVYTGLVFFRELPAGIPGAYRLLANILALPNN